MRPKHRILCVSSDESSLSQLAYCLHINGYHPIKAASGPEAIEAFNSDPMIDLVIIEEKDCSSLVERLKKIRHYKPIMVIVPNVNGVWIQQADAVIPQSVSGIELLERIKVMSARKRGPRK